MAREKLKFPEQPKQPEPKKVKPGLFYDRTMNRAQLRACRAVLRRVARAKIKDPMAILGAFDAARSRGWAGPDVKKAKTFARPKAVAPRTKVKTGFTKVWTKRKARRLARAKALGQKQ